MHLTGTKQQWICKRPIQKAKRFPCIWKGRLACTQDRRSTPKQPGLRQTQCLSANVHPICIWNCIQILQMPKYSLKIQNWIYYNFSIYLFFNIWIGSITFFGSWHKEWQPVSMSFPPPQGLDWCKSKLSKLSQSHWIVWFFCSCKSRRPLCSPYIFCWENECLIRSCRKRGPIIEHWS